MQDFRGAFIQQRAAYSAIAKVVNSNLSLPAIYERCHRIIQSIMDAPNMYIAIAEPNSLRFPYFADVLEPENPILYYPREGLTAHVLDTTRSVWFNRNGVPEGIKLVGPMPVDLMSVPILSRQKIPIGVVTVQTYTQGSVYSNNDYLFLHFLASQLAMCIQLVNIECKMATDRIANLVEETMDEHDLYPKIKQVIETVIKPAKYNLTIARVDEQAGLFRSVYAMDSSGVVVPESWDIDTGLTGYLYRNKINSFIYEKGKKELPVDPLTFGPGRPRYWLGASIMWASKIIGLIVIQSNSKENALTLEDEHTLRGMAPYLANTIGKTETLRMLRNS